MKQVFDLEIAGQTYRIASQFGLQYTEKIAAHLNQKLANIESGGGGLSMHQLLILAALDLIDEFFQAEKKHGEEREKLRKEIQETLKVIDQEIEQVKSLS